MARTQGPRRRKRLRYQGHPAKIAARKAQNGPPTPEDLEVWAIKRLVDEEARLNPAEGALVGPLAAAAKYAAPLLCARTPGLDDAEHHAAVANYLTEQLGDVIDEFDPVDYARWRRSQNRHDRLGR